VVADWLEPVFVGDVANGVRLAVGPGVGVAAFDGLELFVLADHLLAVLDSLDLVAGLEAENQEAKSRQSLPQTTDVDVCKEKKKVRVGTGKYFKWL
jgi:hypothetical protein